MNPEHEVHKLRRRLDKVEEDLSIVLEDTYRSVDEIEDLDRNSEETNTAMRAIVRRVDKQLNLLKDRVAKLERKVGP